jgi:FG-GAP-like repeat/Bacterial Ig domain
VVTPPSPVGVELAFTATGSDADNDPLTFSLADGTSGHVPSGAAITSGGDFTWTPGTNQHGDHTFDVCVTDSIAPPVCETITVSVTGPAAPTRFDFTGDGKADILLRNDASGAMYLWQMDGATLTSSTFAGSENPVWETAATADFTGDGKADILLRNSGTGAMYLWQMDGATLVSSTYVGTENPSYVIVNN